MILIGDAPTNGAFDEWLAGLCESVPTVLPVPAAQLVDEVRARAK